MSPGQLNGWGPIHQPTPLHHNIKCQGLLSKLSGPEGSTGRAGPGDSPKTDGPTPSCWPIGGCCQHKVSAHSGLPPNHLPLGLNGLHCLKEVAQPGQAVTEFGHLGSGIVFSMFPPPAGGVGEAWTDVEVPFILDVGHHMPWRVGLYLQGLLHCHFKPLRFGGYLFLQQNADHPDWYTGRKHSTPNQSHVQLS